LEFAAAFFLLSSGMGIGLGLFFWGASKLIEAAKKKKED